MKFRQMTMLLMVLLLAVVLLPMNAEASTLASGTCGENLTWMLDGNGTLTISGEGEMTSAPWLIYWSQVKTVVIEEGVTTIYESAFFECENLTAVTIPEGITSIGYAAFHGCKGLNEITLPSTLTSIGNNAFTECTNLTSVTIPEGVTSIGDWAFSTTGLTSVTIPEGVTVIGMGAFNACESLTEVTLPGTLTDIGEYAFQYSALTSVTIPEGVTSIGDWAFSSTALTSVTIPEGMTVIGMGAFGYCERLTCVALPGTLTDIGEFAFCNAALASVTIPESVTSIGNNAFNGCSSLIAITFTGDVPAFAENAFNGVVADAYYPADNANWTTDVLQDYGGDIRWLPYGNLKITSQPKSVTVAEGETAKVTVEADGVGLTYRWYYKNVGESSYSYTSSFKGNTYSVTMNEARNGRQVLCRVYDRFGNVVQSNTVKLSMTVEALKITQQPVSVTVAEGETARVTVKAAGNGLTYRWYFKNAGESSYTYTSSYKGNTYSVPMNEARNGRQVLCRVYDMYGNVVQTNTVMLSMTGALKIVQQPKSVTVSVGETAKTTVIVSGQGVTYQWYYANPGSAKFYKTNSFTGRTYYISMDDARNGRRVYCVITDQHGNTVTTNTVTLNMS